MKRSILTLCCVVFLASAARGEMFITEWMYQGYNGEFVEFTNLGTTAVDMTGWSYSDLDRQAFDVDLSAFGTVAAGQSVILTESSVEAFRDAWDLASSVKIIGDNLNSNLGRNDEINLYDPDGNVVDTLTYGDEDYPGTIRTRYQSGNHSGGNLGENDVYDWYLATVGDAWSSYASTGGDIGNPGTVPEPATSVLLGAAACLGLLITRWRKKN